MKTKFTILATLAAGLILSTVNAAPQQTVSADAAAKKAAEEKAKAEKKAAEEKAKAEKKAAEMIRSKCKDAIREKRLDDAEKLCSQYLAHPGANNGGRLDTLRSLGYAFRGQNKRAEAAKIFEKIASLGKDYEYTSVFCLGDNYWGARGKEAEMEKYFRILATNPVFTVSQRIDGIANLVNKALMPQKRFQDIEEIIQQGWSLNPDFTGCITLAKLESTLCMEQEQIDKGIAAFDRVLQNPKLTSPQRRDVLKSKADFCKRSMRLTEAAKFYRLSIETDSGNFQGALSGLFECCCMENKAEEGLDIAIELCGKMKTANDFEKSNQYGTLTGFAIQAKQFDKARKLNECALKLEKQPPHLLPARQLESFNIEFEANNLTAAQKIVEKFVAEKHKYAQLTAMKLAERYFARRDFTNAVKNYKFIQNDFFNSDNWVERPKADNMLVAFCLAKQNQELIRAAGDLAKNGKLSKAGRGCYAMVAAQKILSVQETGLNKNEQAEALARYGKLLIRFGENEKAEQVWKERAKFFYPEKRNRLKIGYVKNAPNDVGSWLASPLLKDKKNRGNVTCKYGEEEAAFLITDVMASNRNVGDSSVQADKETYFYMCYDEYGLHLFFVGVDSKVKDVLAGKIGGSGYEMYIAIGEGAPAYQWMFDQPKDKLDIPPWNSPHEFYRHMGNYVNIASRPVENGFATAMNFSWELAYDRLPANGDTWPFELIRWTRGGGVTWGGKAVWDIGDWGRLEFTGLTPQILREIRRVIVYKAFGRYKSQKNAHSGGAIAIWKDPELGDPEFYEKSLKTEVDRLDELGKLVTDDMTDSTIDKLWVEAVPYWFDFEYRAAKLRSEYLNNRFIETGK